MTRLEANVWRRHGPQGILMQRLARYALLGWVLFGCTAVAFCVLAVLAVWRTPPVIAVSRDGAVLGQMEWFHARYRSRRDILAASMRFVRDYLSANSATVMPDYVQALGMMSGPFRSLTVKALKKTAYLARVRKGHLRSWVTFDAGALHPRVVRRAGNGALVRVAGVVHVILPSGLLRRDTFSLLLTEVIVPRTRANTAGVLVAGVDGL